MASVSLRGIRKRFDDNLVSSASNVSAAPREAAA